MSNVLGQVNLFGSPNGRFGLFVKLPNVVVLDGEEDEAVGAGGEERLIGGECRVRVGLIVGQHELWWLVCVVVRFGGNYPGTNARLL